MTTHHDLDRIRNVALISHGGGGKTTLAEALLFNGKAIKQRGTVERGDTVTSTEPEEVARKITIFPHVCHLDWREHHVNLIDTPGFIDFMESTRGTLSVAGGAVMIFSGLSGTKPESERQWSMIEEASVPTIGFINKLDLPRSDFIRALGAIEHSLGVTTLPLTIPILDGEEFKGIVDLIPLTAWSAVNGVFTQIELPESARSDAEHYRQQLVEKLVEANDELLERYLEDGAEPGEEQLYRSLKELTLTRRILPVCCGSASLNIGVRALANAIITCLPSPLDKALIRPLEGVNPETNATMIRAPSPSEPFSAMVLKTAIDPYSGKLSVVRVFSGTLDANQPFLNTSRNERERGGNLFRMQGKEMEPVERLQVGEIGAIAKLEFTKTGDTICAPNAPIMYQRAQYLEPFVAFAIEADKKNEDKAANGLTRLVEEDPTLRFYRDEVTHEMILAGMGQTHMTVVLERLKRKYGAVITLKTQAVPYRETITKPTRVQGRLKKQSGGRGQFGDCWLEMEPLPRNGGYQFEDKIVGGAIPQQFIPSVQKGVVEAMESGIVGGFPVVDVKVVLVDGTYHTVDSSDYAFKVAGSIAFKKGMETAGAALLEPVMAMEIQVPEENMGDVIGDLNSRRGRVTRVVPKAGGNQVIQADVPMAEVLTYGTALNGMTSGRGIYTMRVSTYQEVPSHISRKVLEQRQQAGQEAAK